MAENSDPKSLFWKWLPLFVLSFALTIIILDTTILNVSFKTILLDLHTTIQSLQWVITAYSLTLAACTITGGRLGDLFGRKRMFVTGAIIFSIGSFITSISNNVGTMILGEAIIEGIGASLMMPATASLLVSNYKGRDRQIGFGVWGGIAAAAAALGPVFGGWLTTYYSWRWAFRINVGVAILLVVGSYYIKEFSDRNIKISIDWIGIILSAVGLLSIVFAVIEASTYGWITATEPFTLFGFTWHKNAVSFVPLLILIGLLILLWFTYWEKYLTSKGKSPLVSFSLFRNSQFITATVVLAMTVLGQVGLSFVLPVFLQAVKNLDAFHTGLALLPMPLTILVIAPLSGYIAKFIAPKYMIQLGLGIEIIGFFLLTQSLSLTATEWTLAPGLIVFGLVMGLLISQVSNIALSAVSVEEAGEASGVNSTSRQIGSTFGSAILGALLLSFLSTNLINRINSSTTIPVSLKSTITQAVSKQSSNIEFGASFIPEGNIPQPIKNSITAIANTATVNASKSTTFYGTIAILIAFLISFKLPSQKNIEKNESHSQTKPPAEEKIRR